MHTLSEFIVQNISITKTLLILFIKSNFCKKNNISTSGNLILCLQIMLKPYKYEYNRMRIWYQTCLL